MKRINDNLKTPEFQLLDFNCPLKEYPRPQFKRDSYLPLNGYWDYKIIKNGEDFSSYDGRILVPYCLESKNSQVNKSLKNDEKIVYHRSFDIESSFKKKHTFINFLGVDEEFDLIINGANLGHYVSYSTPIQIEISNAIITGKNEITIIVTDELKKHLFRGKQVRRSQGMFYTSVSGIYFPVFLESVDDNYIKEIKITSFMNRINLEVNTDSYLFNIKIYDQDQLITSFSSKEKELSIEINNPTYWDIDNPHLYQLVISSESDKINSYFGLRQIAIKDNKIYLNNRPLFINGLLDQGYYPEGIYTVSDYKSYKRDIKTIKEVGFNLIRKHMKVECPYFYYLCDKYGMLVMQDFIFNGNYHFLFDTALPTLGLQTIKDNNRHPSIKQQYYFLRHGRKVQQYLSNSPSVIGFTIFNEGWGQFQSDRLYTFFKSKDPTRLYDSTSGWFRNQKTDFLSLHIYFKKIKNNLESIDKPLLISEFGGYVYKIPEKSYNLKKTFGYKFFYSTDDLLEGLYNLYIEQILPIKDQISGVIYTQLSDVEDETNGLFTYDRTCFKVNKKALKDIFNRFNE